jgi:hypothetical protein
MYVVLSVAMFALVLGALADIITAGPWRIRHLPKVAWIIIVIVLPLIGSILWFAVGREYSRPPEHGGLSAPHQRQRSAAASRDIRRRDTQSELEALDQEILAAQKEERIQRLEAEIRARRGTDGTGG